MASRYPNHAQPLWNLPGGRQRHGELLENALQREFAEETGLEARVRQLLYVSESYDSVTGYDFLNVTFAVDAHGDARASGRDAHVVDLASGAARRLARLSRSRRCSRTAAREL